ncbi:hypothetical protein PWT90_02218 [Aphanocladium album]|nr:hypothetical protein PWT90_02218 [Aphanocladium album]
MDFDKVILARPCDWTIWFKTLSVEAHKLGVWDYIDPAGEMFLLRPDVPLLPKQLQRMPSIAEDGVEAVELYNRALHHFTNVTLPLYTMRLDRYIEDAASLDKMEQFFDQTVSKLAYGEMCARAGTLRGKIATLQGQLMPTRQTEVNDAYWALEEHLSKEIVDDDDWSIKWSRDLRAALLRCESLQAMDDDHIFRVGRDVHSIFFRDGAPRKFPSACDPDKGWKRVYPGEPTVDSIVFADEEAPPEQLETEPASE